MADDLDAIFDAAHSGGGGGGDDLDRLFDAAHGIASPQGSLPSRVLKQFGAGAIAGTTGLAALVGDMNPSMMIGDLVTGQGIMPMRGSKIAESFNQRFLPAPEDNEALTRYARTAGEFIGPTALTGGFGKAAQLAGKAGPVANYMGSQLGLGALGSSLTGALAAQGAEDVTGNTTVAPLVGGVLGAAGPRALSNIGKGVWSVLRPASQSELQGSAGIALRETTGLSADDIAKAMAASPDDELGRLMSTAEITDNAGFAQLEKTLAAKGPAAVLYDQKYTARGNTRDALLGSTTTTRGVNPEGLGSSLIEQARNVADDMDESAMALWQRVPREAPVDITTSQESLRRVLDSRQAGLEPGSKVRNLLNQFLEPVEEGTLTSGALQDIRSDALSILRDQNLRPFETRALGALQSEINSSMQQGLEGPNYARWRDAADATALRAQTFAPSTAGGSLLNQNARPRNVLSNALKGDSRSAAELRIAIGENPALLEDVKRGLLDKIGRNGEGQITPAAMQKFITGNEGTIRTIFGEEHFGLMQRIAEDLASQAKVARSAFRASEGGATSAQKTTVAGAIYDEVVGAIIPDGKLVGRIASRLQGAAASENVTAINGLLFRAAMEPAFALELAKAPNTTRVLNAMERLRGLGLDALIGGGKGAALSISGQEEQRGQARPGSQLSQASSQLPKPPAPSILQGQGTLSPTQQGPQQNLVPRVQNAPLPAEASLQSSSVRTSTPGLGPQAGPAFGLSSPNSAPKQDQTQAVFGLLLKAVEHVESRGNPNAVSSKGAIGTHQVTPPAMRDVLRSQGVDDRQYTDAQLREIAKQPGASKKFGEAYLQMLLGKYNGNITKALTAYHSGIGNVEKGTIGPEGKKYAPAVTAVFEKLLQRV